jgi:hypothetical protein
MYRLYIDIATRELISSCSDPPARVKYSLGHRLQWLFDNNLLPDDLRALADSIKEDGNDAAYDGTLTMEDAEDVRDFCVELLRRIYTEPARLQLAKDRRTARRKSE